MGRNEGVDSRFIWVSHPSFIYTSDVEDPPVDTPGHALISSMGSIVRDAERHHEDFARHEVGQFHRRVKNIESKFLKSFGSRVRWIRENFSEHSLWNEDDEFSVERVDQSVAEVFLLTSVLSEGTKMFSGLVRRLNHTRNSLVVMAQLMGADRPDRFNEMLGNMDLIGLFGISFSEESVRPSLKSGLYDHLSLGRYSF